MMRTFPPAKAGRQEQLRRRALLGAAGVILLLPSGCAGVRQHRHTPAIPWEAAARNRPRLPEKSSAAAAAESVPDLQPLIPPPGALFNTLRSAPPRPRMPAAPAAETDAAGPVEAPVIAPQLSAAEASAAQEQTRQSLGLAEQNLARARGRSFTSMQADLAEKVRGFIDQAREAGRETDWVRARNLAEKAQLLSEELVRSL
ncbi:MAG: hypothetical protein LAN84_08755 [Acidobacteriia bacterium]|nr:hypothetical protein [Terriglobia bacterium]